MWPNSSLDFRRVFCIWVLRRKPTIYNRGLQEDEQNAQQRCAKPPATEIFQYDQKVGDWTEIGGWNGTVFDEFQGCAENASAMWLRSSCLSSLRALRLVEAKTRLLHALSIVPVPVLFQARLLLKTVRDRPLAPESSRYASSACRSA
ncbi:unnamed protein product [Coccothraustes coccothraustes]